MLTTSRAISKDYQNAARHGRHFFILRGMRVLILICLVLLSLNTAKAQLLGPSQILDSIEGLWGVPLTAGEASDIGALCEEMTLSIWIEKTESGTVYFSQFKDSEVVFRSPVKTVTYDTGESAPFIQLKYDSEERLDEDGNIVEWRLIMPSKDKFVWQRVGWPVTATTPARHRCKLDASS